VNVGDGNPATNVLDGPAASDEVAMPFLKKAGPGRPHDAPRRVHVGVLPDRPVRLVPRRGPRAVRPLFTVPEGNAQTLAPATRGATRFDPGKNTFGLYSTYPIEPHGSVFSDDAANTWDTSETDNQHKVRFYPFKKPYGRVVPNTYVVAMEQAFNSDFQDAVLVIENVVPYDAVFAPGNLTAVPSSAPTAVTLSWTDNSDNESGFVVERSRRKNGTYETIATVPAGTTLFEDQQVAEGTRYYYRVRAITAKGHTAISNRAVANT
jgi:hypothetical protein